MLLSLLGDPQDNLRYIHIAGTNGKGSVAAMLSSILTAAGYRTGLFVSPGIEAVNDRFRIDGNRIQDELLITLAKQVQQAADQVSGSFCEFALMMCVGFLYFSNQNCDIVVLETGIGGRQDCTNLIPHKEAAVITSVGFDHTELLGNTLTEIASEKAGIIAQNGFAVCGVMPKEAKQEIAKVVKMLQAEAVFIQAEDLQLAGFFNGMQILSYQKEKGIPMSLLGHQQLYNGAVVLEVCKGLNRAGWHISTEAVEYGLAHTIWEGRMEVLSHQPLVVLDGAHNSESAALLYQNLNTYFSEKNVIFVIGMMKDKDKKQVLETLLPGCKAAIAVTIPGGRGEQDSILQDIMKEYCQDCSCNGTIKEALTYAESICEPQDMICVCGSLYLIQEVRAYYKAGGCVD